MTPIGQFFESQSTRALGYSAGAAHRRIQSMRLLKSLPEMESQIESGTLSLCVAARTQSFFRNEDQKRKHDGDAKLSRQDKTEIVESLLGTSIRECEKKLAAISPASALPKEKIRETGLGKTSIQFSATGELMEKLEKLKGLLAHQNPDGGYEGLFEILAEIALRKIEPKSPKKQEETPPENDAQGASVSTVEKHRSRYIPVAVKQRVFARDGGNCTYTDDHTGSRCGSRFGIQYDHIWPFAWGGESSESNLRLRCRAHNSYTAKKLGLMRERRNAGV